MNNLGQTGTEVNFQLLEQACNIVLGGGAKDGEEFKNANNSLMQFQQRDDAWNFIGPIMDNTTSIYAKFFGIKIFIDLVKFKWAMLDPGQRQSIKDFACQHVYDWGLNPNIPPYLINQLDTVLVELIVREWPQEWPSIVSDLIGSANSEPRTCQNNLKILGMVSQKVVDFGSTEMTSTRIAQVTTALNGVAPDIYQLIQTSLHSTDNYQLVSNALETYRYTVKWLTPDLIFGTDLLNYICHTYLQNPQYQSQVLYIIGEITSKQNLPERYTQSFPEIFDLIISSLNQTLADADFVQLSTESPELVKSLIFNLSSFLSSYVSIIEKEKQYDPLSIALNWVVEIMKITEWDNFKSCCELWRTLIRRYYLEQNPSTFDFYNSFFPIIRRIMVVRMERPREVLIVENPDGTVEKEMTKNSAQLDHYNTMREALVFLSNIDNADTIQAITERVEQLHQQYSIPTLNSITWSAGAISGTLKHQDEKRFVIMIIKELLQLSANEYARTEDKAMIASGIMFVCSSYPRFLMDNWAFFKTIEAKLFEFMQNDFPGVKEMAVESFTRIADSCKKKLLLPEGNGEPSNIEYLIFNFDGITSTLSNELKSEMINAISLIISGCRDIGQKSKLTHDLMNNMNEKWKFQLTQFSPEDFGSLVNVLFILRCNIYVATNVGEGYHVQFQSIFDQMIEMYGMCCQICTNILNTQGPQMAQGDVFRICYQIKSSILQIIIKFSTNTQNVPLIQNIILPPLTMNLLNEYENSNPLCRVPELLILADIIIGRIGEPAIYPYMNQILMQLFKSSYELISQEFDSFMDFRIPLTDFMKSVVKSAFDSLVSLPIEGLTIFENTIEWGCQHPNFDICKKNIELLHFLFSTVENKAPQAFKNQFYGAFYISALSTIFGIMTDTVHSFAFPEQAKILKKLFSLQIDQRNPETIVQMLSTKFPNRQPQFFSLIVERLLTIFNSYDLFVATLRDFLVEVKQVSPDDPDLFVEERRQQQMAVQKQLNEVPGLNGPADIDDFLD